MTQILRRGQLRPPSSVTRTIPRHAVAVRHPRVEPVQWLLSGASRGWRWVWSVDHDDLAPNVAAWLIQFSLLAGLFLAVVLASR